jgi:uncharacterized membrane protein YdjX (TVP38/TMEM64 family)
MATQPLATRPRWLLPLAGLVLAGVAVALAQGDVAGALRAAVAWVGSLGAVGPLIFVALYVVATVLLLPASVLTLGAGAVFGVAAGAVYVSVAATLGATAAFLIGRYLARDLVAHRIAGNPRFAAIDEAVAAEGWKIVGLLRLSPLFPFSLLNYALGLTRVRLPHYVLASWIGMMPGTVAYVYVGSLAQAAVAGQSWTTGQRVLYGVGLVATIAVTVLVTRIARRALAVRIAPGDA